MASIKVFFYPYKPQCILFALISLKNKLKNERGLRNSELHQSRFFSAQLVNLLASRATFRYLRNNISQNIGFSDQNWSKLGLKFRFRGKISRFLCFKYKVCQNISFSGQNWSTFGVLMYKIGWKIGLNVKISQFWFYKYKICQNIGFSGQNLSKFDVFMYKIDW